MDHAEFAQLLTESFQVPSADRGESACFWVEIVNKSFLLILCVCVCLRRVLKKGIGFEVYIGSTCLFF